MASCGIKFVVERNPHDCVIHRDGPVFERQHDSLSTRAEQDNRLPHDKRMPAYQRRTLDAGLLEVKKKVDNYHRHLEQFKVRRCFRVVPWHFAVQVQRERIEHKVRKLKDKIGHAVVIEDFVSRYTGGPDGGRNHVELNTTPTMCRNT